MEVSVLVAVSGCLAPWWVVEVALLGNAVDASGLLNLSLHHAALALQPT